MEQGPKAPRDPEKKRKSFYIMREKEICAGVQPGGRGTTFIFLNDGRMVESARMNGRITDEGMLHMLESAEGFRELVYSIGVTAEEDDRSGTLDFVLQMYGKRDVYGSGTTLSLPVVTDGSEHILRLSDFDWSKDDDIPGQIRFEFPRAGTLARVSVRFYLQDGFDAPEPEEEQKADFSSPYYGEMLEKSLLKMGNPFRIKKVLEKARAGEKVKLAFIGGSITQGAGAAPIHTACYPWRAFTAFCHLAGKGTDENISYCKAGVGGTPSELGMIRYDRDVCLEGQEMPDLVVVEFAVNDDGDETKGECYDSLVRKILASPGKPGVILLFSVFADDWNLQERLSPVGEAYDLPMVSIRDAVVEQFYKKWGQGRVISKPQFFYDRYHPTNLGHRIMGDALEYLFKKADGTEAREDMPDVNGITPPLGGSFEKVRLLDRKQSEGVLSIDPGDFDKTDQELQMVERDRDPSPVPEFPFNWKHASGSRPFVMEINCSTLLLVCKDSALSGAGKAEVRVDGQTVFIQDPREVGWTHCNARIIFRDQERKARRIEIGMCPGEEDKEFTILGFGIV